MYGCIEIIKRRRHAFWDAVDIHLDTMVIIQRSKNLLRIIIEKEVFHFNELY